MNFHQQYKLGEKKLMQQIMKKNGREYKREFAHTKP
jgi:hypothetical protein